MPKILLFAIVTITLALVCYTIGVWSEKLQKTLKLPHLIFFWLGFAFDTTGTSAMSILAKGGAPNTLHAVTGVLAIVLMLFHAIWATIVLLKNDEKLKANFHKLSMVVWLIWLIPFISGMVMGMSR